MNRNRKVKMLSSCLFGLLLFISPALSSATFDDSGDQELNMAANQLYELIVRQFSDSSHCDAEITDDNDTTCDICHKTFGNKSSFYIHRQKHVGKTYTCPYCKREIKDPSNLNKHIKIVHEK